MNLFGNDQDEMNESMALKKRLSPENELVNKYPIDPEMNCILLVQGGGTVYLEESLLSLK